jgi:hypothetical protein
MDVVDDRTVVDFQKTTFCGHPRAAVSKFLLQNIQLGHADYACYWSLELLCSGLVHTLWMSLFDAAAVHVNRANPNVFLYLASAYETYAPYESNFSALEMTKLRNNPDVRRMVCEAAAVIALCRKNKLPSLPTIKPSHDFDAVTLQESIRAPSTLYGKLVLRRDDPLSMAVPMNELCYCLRSDVRDTTRSLYWMSWIYAYCREHKKQTKSALTFADRSDEFVSGDHARHVVWMLWDAVKKQAQPTARPVLDVLYIARTGLTRFGFSHFVKEKLNPILYPGTLGVVVGKSFKRIQAGFTLVGDCPQHSAYTGSRVGLNGSMTIKFQLPITQNKSTLSLC